MIYLSTNRKTYERLVDCLPDLMPNIIIDVLVMDNNLEKLGFCESALCKIAINMNSDELENLLDELMDIETDMAIACDGNYYGYENNYYYKQYEKYCWMYDIFYYVKAVDQCDS